MMPPAAAGPAWIACWTSWARFCGSLLAPRNWLTSRWTSARDAFAAESALAAAGNSPAARLITASATAPARVRSVMVSLFSRWERVPCRLPPFYLAGFPAAIVPSVGLLAVA